jgi:ATP-dependent DNA helicase DinG
MHARDLLGPDGPLARAIPGYEHRESQLAMADAVEQALEAEGVLLVEAGTGTGKTLAYLVPAILSGRKVVVSTGTKTLQDQLMEHDLPMLERHLGLPVRAACLKGLANYLCLRRYEDFLGSPEADRAPFERLVPTIRRFRETTASGDRAELSLPEDVPIWSQVSSSSETRLGARCPHFEACFVTKMRRAAEDAQLLVVNHHLFFADLATRGPHGGGALPDYDAIIFDEAHQVEDVATEFFGRRVSTARVEAFVRDAQRALGAAGLSDDSAPRLRAVLDSAAQFFTSLPRPPAGNESRLTLEPRQLPEAARDAMLRLDAELEALSAHCKLRSGAGEAVAQMARRAAAIRDDVASILDGRASPAPEKQQVAWTELRGRSVSLGASPVDVSAIMREEVFGRTRAVVLTSATLATDGSFAFTKQRLGVASEVDELVVPSPFDYPRQAALYTPRTMPDPRDPGFLEAAAEEIVALVELTGGGAFVLTTSVRAMQELARRCVPRLRNLAFVQGAAPKAALLEGFRKDGHAVLFATASFWEGVDVPGDALRLVVIDKLPFDVPTDPLVAARTKRLEDEGRQAFMEYLVPAAAISLKQGFGRLVRTRKDHGIVAVLDRRLTTKGYGKVFLRSLPPAKRCDTRADLEDFWRGIERDAASTAAPGGPIASSSRL